MGTTSQKLTYLNDTKGLLKDRINSLGGNITSQTTFRNYATELDNIYDELPKVSGTGTSINLTPTLKGRITSQMNGDTLQDGTPTPDAPINIQTVTGRQLVEVCGKNLLNISSNYQVTGGPIYFDLENPIPAGTYIISITGFETTGTTEGLIHFLDSNNSQMAYAGLNNTTKTITITVSNPITRLRLYSQNSAGASSGITSTFVNLMISINGGDYEPYTGQKYEINLGKNLLDSSTLQDGYITNTGTINSSHPLGEMYSDYIKVLPNTAYTFKIFETSTSNENWFGIGEYTSTNESSFVRRDAEVTGTREYCIFTTSSTTNYIRVSARNLKSATKIQLEKGSATTYAPYFTPIELNKIGTYQDSIKKSTGKNLFDGIFETGGYDTTNGQKSVSNDRIRCVDYIEVKSNTTYTFSFENDGSAYFLEYDSNKTYLNKYTLIMYHTKSGTITTSSNTKYITFYYIPYNHTLTTNELCQIEQNSQATSYEPYLPKGTWYIEKKVGSDELGRVTFDKNDTWSSLGNNTNAFYKGYLSFNNMKSHESIMCDRLGYVANVQNYDMYGIYLTSNVIVRVPKTITTPAELKTWFSNNNTKVIYPLETPTYTEITNKEQLGLDEIENMSSYKGETNIVIMSENLPTIMNASAIKGE